MTGTSENNVSMPRAPALYKGGSGEGTGAPTCSEKGGMLEGLCPHAGPPAKGRRDGLQWGEWPERGWQRSYFMVFSQEEIKAGTGV